MDEGNTAVLETPAAEAPSGPANTPAPDKVAAPENNGDESQVTEKTKRPERTITRDPKTRKWVKKETAGAETVVVKPKEKDPFDDAAYQRGEKAGLTRYEIKKLGALDKLDAEIVKRDQERTVAEQRRQQQEAAEAAKRTAPPPQPEVKATEPPAAPAAADDPLGKLPKIDPDLYGEEVATSIDTLRAVVERQRDELAKFHSLSDKFGELEKRAQEDAEQRERAAQRAASLEVDEALNGLGEELAPIFGKGNVDTLGETGYGRVRGNVFQLMQFLEQFHGGMSRKEVALIAAAALYPEEFKSRHERDVYERAKKSGAQRGFSGAAVETPAEPFVGPSKKNPAIKEKAHRMRLENAGLLPKSK